MKILLVTATALSSFFFGLFGVDWDKIDARIEKDYPGVELVAARDLQGAMEESAVLVFDVREAEEFAVSHLPEAIHLQTAGDIAARYPDRNAEIVVYCAVGLRAAAVAAELQALGYTRVRNLRHAIFAWANAGHPLVDHLGATDKVHPYNRAWATLVDADLRSYQPR